MSHSPHSTSTAVPITQQNTHPPAMSRSAHSTASILQGASHNTFYGSTFTIRSERIAPFDRLEMASSPSAFHNYVNRPQPGRCYPNTRVDLLNSLGQWAVGFGLPKALFSRGWSSDPQIDREDQPSDCPILWLRGGAGAGKSAVAQTFAERCEDSGHIVASFFFFRTDTTRNTADPLVASLAYQIAVSDPTARAEIERVICQYPQIFHQQLTQQIQSLVINPILRSAELVLVWRRRQCVIIIDGLDECVGETMQAAIIGAICDSLRSAGHNHWYTLPRVLICSRPEELIKCIFTSASLQGMYSSINLSNDYKANDDIRTFLEGKFYEIKKGHLYKYHIPAWWPSHDNICLLVSNSSGHFIYAQTVVKVIEKDARPVAALDGILGLRALPQHIREPFAELDELYRHILRRALFDISLRTIQLVLGFVICCENSSLRPDVASQFLGLEDGDLETLVTTMSSLIYLHDSPVFDYIQELDIIKAIPHFYHKSFTDFLCDANRAGEFYIETQNALDYVCARLIDLGPAVVNLHQQVCEFVQNLIFTIGICYSWTTTYSVLRMTQKRDFWKFLRLGQFDKVPHLRAEWVAFCLRYWLELQEHITENCLIKEATSVMIEILRDLMLLPAFSRVKLGDMSFVFEKYDSSCLPVMLPLLMARKLRVEYEDDDHVDIICPVHNLTQNPFLALLATVTIEGRGYDLEQLLEDAEMGDNRLTGDRYAEAIVFWMSYLSKNGKIFSRKIKQIIQNRHNVLVDYPGRHGQASFRWRGTKRTIPARKTAGKIYFNCFRGWFSMKPSPKVVEGNKTPFKLGYINQNLFFRREMLVRKHHRLSTEQEGALWSKLKRTFGQEGDRRRQFGFILSRVPGMLQKASKSDAVAALRSKAFPPLSRCFPRSTRRARQALETYAARHGYDSPYVNAGNKYNPGLASQNYSLLRSILSVASSAPSIIIHPPFDTNVLTPGQQQSCSPAVQSTGAVAPSANICDEPGCEQVIGEMIMRVECSSPGCNRKYHLRCQGMIEAPVIQLFCSAQCKRDVEVRKCCRINL